jgi:hypothetical protein
MTNNLREDKEFSNAMLEDEKLTYGKILLTRLRLIRMSGWRWPDGGGVGAGVEWGEGEGVRKEISKIKTCGGK